MTDEAKALVDHIRSDLTYITGLADHMEAGGDVSKKNIGDLIAIVRWNAEHHLECRDTIETQAREIERLRTEGRFLLARLDELEWLDGQLEETARYYFGHVDPAIYHFRAALAGDSHDQ